MTTEEGSALDVVQQWAQNATNDGVTVEPGANRGETVITMPGDKKLKTSISVVVRQRSVSASCFVVRRPDENHQAFYYWMLRKNAKLPGASFSLDRDGDVYLQARLPIFGFTSEAFDQMMGMLAITADESFNELLALGFMTAIRKEWQWRTDRGESTANLAAFEKFMVDHTAD